MLESTPDFRKRAVVILCLLLALFMTVEAGHKHPTVQTSCAWCSTAHVLAVPASVTPFSFPFNTGEAVAVLVRTEKSLLMIPFQLIRPPPISSKYRT